MTQPVRQLSWRGWLPLLVLPAAVLLGTPTTAPRWLFMWLLALAIYGGCKWLTWRRTPAPGVSWQRQLGYLLIWPGLDARAFLTLKPLPSQQCPTPRAWLRGVGNVLLGVGVLWGLTPLLPADQPLVVGWAGMVGIILLLHFGTFQLLSCAWRSVGVEARPLMNRPLAATSVSDFWGKRWNTAFRDLTHRFLFQPLKPWLGPHGAIVGGFLFSGVVHDLVISVQAGGGYGGPTLFFGVQAAALLTERSSAGKKLGLGRGWRGWLFTLLVLAGPAFCLFHLPFITAVVLPFLEFLGAR